MGVKLTDLASFAERMSVKPCHNQQVTLTQEERNWLVAKLDEELRRNKSVLQRKCSTSIKPKTREKFERQWAFLYELRAKIR